MQITAQEFPWAEELEKTVVNSLVTSFGLDFLLFKDKCGGDVNTIHNVRNGVWATENEQRRYEQRGNYDPTHYHQHANYKKTGERDKELQKNNSLDDPYRNRKINAHEKRNLDHVISAKEIHDDPGRILAEQSGVEISNQNSNLQSTHATVNKSKGQTSISEYLKKLPELIEKNEAKIANDRARLANMPRDTPQQQDAARKIEDRIRKTENKVKELKNIDPDEMRKRDAEARAAYEQQINYSYYTSSKFLYQTAHAAGKAGIAMGTRQMLGLIMAEVWFELREQLPSLLVELKDNFCLNVFLDRIKTTLRGIWERVKARFSDFLVAFRDGIFSGVLGSLTTTAFNIFATTQAMVVKIIREVWPQIVKAIKILAFNPENLSFVEQCKAVTSLLSIGAAATVGSIAYTQLLPICSFPFGAELASFSSAFITGVVTLGLNYFLLYSDIARKLWEFVESLGPHAVTLQEFKKMNSKLDNYLTEISQIEFNFDMEDLQDFKMELKNCASEYELSIMLRQKAAIRGIQLPFEIGDRNSTLAWLKSRA